MSIPKPKISWKRLLPPGLTDGRGRRVDRCNLIKSGSMKSVHISWYIRGDWILTIVFILLLFTVCTALIETLWRVYTSSDADMHVPTSPLILRIYPLYIIWMELVLSIFAVIWLLFGHIYTNRYFKILIKYHLSESRCPACMADMRGQPVEKDDCVVCPNPECGHAWKITDKVAQP